MAWLSSCTSLLLLLGCFFLVFQECSTLGEPDLSVEVGYWAYVIYTMILYVNDPKTYPTPEEWEHLLTFEAYSVEATALLENADTTFTCIYQCEKYSDDYWQRFVVFESEAALLADDTCLTTYEPICFPDDVTGRSGFERLIFADWWWPGYYSTSHTSWVQPERFLPAGNTYSAGGTFDYTTPMIPSEATDRDIASANQWNILANVWARVNWTVGDSVCYGGFQMSETTGNCEHCTIGSYRPVYQRESGDCWLCPQNSTGKADGDLNSYHCICDLGFAKSYSSSDVSPEVLLGRTTEVVCVACSAGEFGSAETCTACSPGTYTSELAQSACIITSPGYYQPSEGGTESLACQAGTYALWSGSTECHDCPEGYFGKTEGMSACDAAPAGYITNGTGATKVIPCSAGTYRLEGGDGGSCTECPAGTYSAEEAADSCIIASPGYFTSEAGLTESSPCGPGTYSGRSGSASCTECVPGSFVNTSAATSCHLTSPGYYQDLSGQTNELPCTAGHFSGAFGSATCEACSVGSYAADDAASTCTTALPGYYQGQIGQTESLECQPGTYAGSSGSEFCSECDPGSFSNESGSSRCSACTAGHFQDLSGQTAERPCPPGSYNPSTGMAACLACDPGNNQTSYGQVRCEICPRGTYGDGGATYDAGYSFQTRTVNCNQCPTTSTTVNAGSASVDACICPVGSWGENTNCTACTTGMLCDAVGLSLPKQEKGYMVVIRSSRRLSAAAAADVEFDIWRCQESDACPSGPAGTCAENRDPSEVACGKCLVDFHFDSDANCVACSTTQASLVLLAVCVLACIVLVGLAFFANRQLATQKNAVRLFTTSLGMAVAAFQIMSVFVNLSVTWRDPLKYFLEAMSFMSLDFETLSADCVLGSNVAMMYASRQVSPIVAALLLAVILLCKKRWYDPELRLREEFVNAVGAATQMLFIAILISVTVPFICYDHPNGMSSMVRHPEVLCFEDSSHYAMVGISIAACCTVVLSFVVLVLYGVFRLPAAKRSSSSMMVHLRMFKFLFFQYETHAYYFGVIALIRGLLVCLVPVVIRDEGAAQVLAILVIMLGFQICARYVQPWSSSFANSLDGILTAFLILMLLCVQLTESSNDAHDDLISVVGAICFICTITSIVVAILLNIRWYMQPHPFWTYFVCHHKADAASQARFLQLTFVQKTGKACFIDSDHLANLDGLFDIVRSKIQYLIVFMTSDTLKRPWCAGEVTVAHSTHKRAIPVYTPSFEKPSDDEISATQILRYMAKAEFDLSDYGLGEEALAEAFQWILGDSLPIVTMRTTLASRLSLVGVVEDCTDVSTRTKTRTKSEAKTSLVTTIQELSNGNVVIAADPADDEACAGAGIVMLLISQRVVEAGIRGVTLLHELPDLDVADLEEVPMRAQSVIIVLSEGSMKLDMQLYLIAETMKASDTGISVVPLTLPSFRFPTQSYFLEYLPQRFPEEAALLESSLKAFFKRIAVQFATHSSIQVLEAQAVIIFDRLDKKYVAGKSAKSIREISGTKSDEWGSQMNVHSSRSSKGVPASGAGDNDSDAASDSGSLTSF